MVAWDKQRTPFPIHFQRGLRPASTGVGGLRTRPRVPPLPREREGVLRAFVLVRLVQSCHKIFGPPVSKTSEEISRLGRDGWMMDGIILVGAGRGVAAL